MQTAFVLTDKNGQILDRDMLDLYDGYLELAYNVKLFKESDLYLNPNLISKDDIFCGHVSICNQIWKNLKIKPPELQDYPIELKDYFKRHIRKTTLKQFYKFFEENDSYLKEYFIKPVKNKIFTGYVVSNHMDLNKLTCSKNTEIYVSDTIKIDAEFRTYVYNNQIMDVIRYFGNNWSVVINKNDVETMVSLLKNVPCFYSLDFGITDKGETVLIEINDGYALGNYGLTPKNYALYSSDRWKEIVKGN